MSSTAAAATSPALCFMCKKEEGHPAILSPFPCACFSVCKSCAMKCATGGKCKVCHAFYTGFKTCKAGGASAVAADTAEEEDVELDVEGEEAGDKKGKV